MTDTRYIDGNNIYDYFISGARRLIHSEKNLNSINVFPVADGDTGTNMALTMKMIILKSKKNNNFDETLMTMSEAAVENAYGNSGMIFAQFINGFFIEAQGKGRITPREFAEIAQRAARHAYNAVGSPKEGTILSVMRDWAGELKSSIGSADFEKIFKNSVDKARDFVDKTKYKMKVFMENNVVDAGAKAFLIFLEGIHDFIKRGEMAEEFSVEDAELNSHENSFVNVEVNENRYCSQFYIETQTEPQQIKETLMNMGESLVVTGNAGNIKIHIHTGTPDKIMSYLAGIGDVHSQKIEDMKIAAGIIHSRKHSIGIVTDSVVM